MGFVLDLIFGTERRLRKRLRAGRPARVDVEIRGAAQDLPAHFSRATLVLNPPPTFWIKKGGHISIGERGVRVVDTRRRVKQMAEGNEVHVVLRIEDRHDGLLEISVPAELEPLVSGVVERSLTVHSPSKRCHMRSPRHTGQPPSARE